MKRRLATWLVFAALALAVFLLSRGNNTPRKAHASDPVNVSISSAAGGGCNSETGPTTCNVAAGGNFAVNFNLVSLPTTTNDYTAYEFEMTYTAGLSYVGGSLVQQGGGVWPECDIPVGEGAFTPGDAKTACTIGVSTANSTYLGVLMHLDFQCNAVGTATLTLVAGDMQTDIYDGNVISQFESANESLTINCLPNFSLGAASGAGAGSGTSESCNSDGSSTCSFALGATFHVNLDLMSSATVSYKAYDALVTYSGVTATSNSLTAGYWPDCFASAQYYAAGQVRFGCTIAVGGSASTYTGRLATVDFTCTSTGSSNVISLVHGSSGDTRLVQGISVFAAEGEGTTESITINCGAPPPTPTLTPTPTPVPVTTVTGTGVAGDSPSGTSATSASVRGPTNLLQTASALYFSDTDNCKVKKIAGGISYLVAGSGSDGSGCGFSGDSGSATSAQLNHPRGLAIDSSGNLYIADMDNCRIREVSGGTITTVAGDGTCGFGGDSGSATSAQLNHPSGVAIDGSDNLYIADRDNCRIRKVSGGTITTVAGTGTCGFGGDGGAATAAQLDHPSDIVLLNPTQNFVIADRDNCRIRFLDTAGGSIYTIAGSGASGSGCGGFSGDGGPATSAELDHPEAVASLDYNVFVADTQNDRIRRVDTVSQIIVTLAGQGGLTGNATVADPEGVSAQASGSVLRAGPGIAFAIAGDTCNWSNTPSQQIAGIDTCGQMRGGFEPVSSCSTVAGAKTIDWALPAVLLGFILARRRLGVFMIRLRSAVDLMATSLRGAR